jgi:hypothetical protein
MISTDLIVAAPWIVFGAALVAVCVQLLRSRRAERPARRPAQTQEEQCPEKKETAPKR